MLFYYKTVKVFIQNELVGFFIFSVREGHLKTLHFNIPDGIEKEVSIYLKQFCAKHKIEVFTVYKYEVGTTTFYTKIPIFAREKIWTKNLQLF